MKEGWEYKTIKECCTELFAGGDVPKPDVSKNKTQNFTVPIYTNGVENEGLYGYTNNARVYEPAVTISARGTIGATFRRYTPFYPAIRLITAVPNKGLLCIDYLYYALKTLTVGNSGTSIPQLTIPNIKNIVIPVPPLSEQQSIVDYLDSAFAKIDAMKANAEKALNEAKALFQASLKEMLEPKEGTRWSTIGDLFETYSGGTPTKSNKEYYEGGTIPWLRSGEVCQKEIKETEMFITEKGLKESSAKYYPENTVVVAMYGATAAQVGILRIKATSNQAVCGILPHKDFLPEFVYYWFSSIEDKLAAQAQGGAQPNISQQKIKKVEIPIYFITEQQFIVATLDSLKSKVDRLQANFEKISQECDALKQALLREVFEG